MTHLFETQYVTLDVSRTLVETNLIGSGVRDFIEKWYVYPALSKMLRGDRINDTENRAVGHPYQRFAGMGPHKLITNELMYKQATEDNTKMSEWVEKNGKRFKHIVNIGIGGSYLGNRLLAHYVLSKYGEEGRTITFVTNDDIGQWNQYDHIAGGESDETLFVICSKSFTTGETLKALQGLRQVVNVKPENIIAVTNNVEAAAEAGIDTTFPMPEWVGGRFSIWGSCSLAARVYLGNELFDRFVSGGRTIDVHMAYGKPETNIPIILALIDHHYHTTMGAESRCIAPYSEALRYLPTYLQQLEMESLGKPNHLNHSLAVWGEIGPDCQHSYFQLIHQGPKIIPVEFILVKNHFNQELNISAIAQAKALYEGQGDAQGTQRPSTLIAIDDSIEGLGALLAIYEYKVFVLAQILGLNAFDQPGVELGKRLMIQLLNGENIDEITDQQLKIVGIK